MPNYVTNIIFINGPAEQVSKLLDQIAFDGKPGTFDFNKVIPMPKGLDLTEGSVAEKALDVYLSVMNPDNRSKLVAGEKLTAEEFLSAVQDARACRHFYIPATQLSDKQIAEIVENSKVKTPESLIRMGKQYLTNYREYGATTWYDWSIKHWGTKWNNAPDTPVWDEKTGCLHFDTAWSMPEPIFKELSRQYPDLNLDVSWADEDIGYNVGNREYKNGKQISEYIPEPGTQEAEEMAFDIKGAYSEELTLYSVELGDLIKEAQSRLETNQQNSQEKTGVAKPKHSPER